MTSTPLRPAHAPASKSSITDCSAARPYSTVTTYPTGHVKGNTARHGANGETIDLLTDAHHERAGVAGRSKDRRRGNGQAPRLRVIKRQRPDKRIHGVPHLFFGGCQRRGRWLSPQGTAGLDQRGAAWPRPCVPAMASP